MRTHIYLNSGVVLLALAACGGAQKGSGLAGGKDVPPPPPVPTAPPSASKDAKPEPKHEVSKDAKADYQAAMANFMANDKGGWNESACRGSADKFSAVAREHSDLVEAQVMAGLSFERCGLTRDAESAYQA